MPQFLRQPRSLCRPLVVAAALVLGGLGASGCAPRHKAAGSDTGAETSSATRLGQALPPGMVEGTRYDGPAQTLTLDSAEVQQAVQDFAEGMAAALSAAGAAPNVPAQADGPAQVDAALDHYDADRDAVALETTLRAALAWSPETAPALVERLPRLTDPSGMLAAARALPAWLDAGLARRCVQVLDGVAGPLRAAGWLALWNRTEPEVLARMAAAFEDTSEDPQARATAGALLEQAWSALDAARQSRLVDRARALLDDAGPTGGTAPGTGPRLAGEAAALLAAAGSPATGPAPEDTRRILDAAERLADPGFRSRALEVLVLAGAPRAELRAAAGRWARDPAMPAAFRDLCLRLDSLLESLDALPESRP